MRRSFFLAFFLASFLAAGLLLVLFACDTASAQEPSAEALVDVPGINRGFPELPQVPKPWLGRLLDGVGGEVAHAGERVARIARGTGDGVRSLLQAGYDALPRRVVMVEGVGGEGKAPRLPRGGASSDAELDEMLQRLDALQTPPIGDMGDRPRRPSGASAPQERNRAGLAAHAATEEQATEEQVTEEQAGEGRPDRASARDLLQRLEARGDMQDRRTREATAHSRVLPPQLVQAGFQDWQPEPEESPGARALQHSAKPARTCLDEQRDRADSLGLAAVGGSDGQVPFDAVRFSRVMPDQAGLLPDGSLFVPKLAQRLLDMRTLQACKEQVPQVKSLTGRIVGNPNTGGLVQAAQIGRIRAGPGGLPELGLRVRAGQPLAVLEPTVSTVERGQLESQLAELRSEIIDTELQLARMRDFPIVPFRSGRMLALRLELDGLRKRRDHLIAGLDNHEVLLSPLDGVISRADTRVGQLVQTGDILWEVADPQRLRVEAVVTTGFPISAIDRARALTSAGESLELGFVGQGFIGEDVVLQFELRDEAPLLRAGAPVTVLLEVGEAGPALLLPREALLEQDGGTLLVWEHLEGERFAARLLMAEPLDEATVAVRQGLAEGARIVHRGADQLMAFR